MRGLQITKAPIGMGRIESDARTRIPVWEALVCVRAQKDPKMKHQMSHAGHMNVFLIVGLKSSDGGLRFTYDQWRQSLLNNKFVRLLNGLQFGMLDADNDGEVSLGDISRAVFRRASDRDQARICRFLEVRT